MGSLEDGGRRVFGFRAVEGGGKVIEDGVVVAAALDGGQEDPFRDNNPFSLEELEQEMHKFEHSQALMDDKMTKMMRIISARLPVSAAEEEEAAEAAKPPHNKRVSSALSYTPLSSADVSARLSSGGAGSPPTKHPSSTKDATTAPLPGPLEGVKVIFG